MFHLSSGEINRGIECVHHKRKIKVCKKCDHQADDERKCHHTRNESQNQEKILSDDLNGPKGFR